MSAPDESAFSKNERPRDYEVRIRIEAEFTMTVEADSEAHALKQGKAHLERDYFDIDQHDIIQARVMRVWKSRPMYRVTRDGKSMQVSHLHEGDIPRAPDERGF